MKKLMRFEEGKKFADEAIFYRNLGDFKKTFKLLKKALKEFDYKPAIVLIGTTAVIKGDIKNAIKWFEVQIKEQQDQDFPLIELYANLGSIYCEYYKNYAKAIEMYTKALEAPRPNILHETDYLQMESNVFRDMAVVYTKMGAVLHARIYAEKRLHLNPTCPACRKIIDNVHIILNKHGDISGGVIEDLSGHFKIILEDNSDLNTIMHSLAFVYAQNIGSNYRAIFSHWAGLPENEWTSEHQELFALALMHYLCSAEQFGIHVPESISDLTQSLKNDTLLPLVRPLSQEMILLFSNLFGG